MKVKNKPKNIEFENVKHCKSLSSLMKGLMFVKRGKALLDFGRPGDYGIWMLFMRFSLDMAFIDENNKILNIFRNVKPVSFNPSTWKVYYPKGRARYVLEVESGNLKFLESGDELLLEN